MICACCPDCRLRLSPAATVYLDACPECGRPPQTISSLEAVVGFRLITLEALPHVTKPAAAAARLAIPDPTGRPTMTGGSPRGGTCRFVQP